MPPTFSLLGGPLHHVGRRLGLVRGDSNTLRLGFVLGIGSWIILAAAAVAEGIGDRMFYPSFIGVHARLLLVIPLLFACESWVAPRMAAFVRGIVESGLVPAHALPALNADVERINRLSAAGWPEGLLFVAAIVVFLTGANPQFGVSGADDPARTTWTALLYFHAVLPLFQFLMFRWMWRLGLWWWFLWRVSRLDLHLLAGHPDGSGGLASVGGVHERFTPLVAAISVIECAALAEDLSRGAVVIESVYPFLVVLLLVDAALFLGPLLVFTDKMWACRTQSMGAYMRFAAHYVAAFEEKWFANGAGPVESPLGTPDLQSLSDLGNSVRVVRDMRWVPVSPRLLKLIAIAALAPLAPLALFKYPLAQMAERIFTRLFGF